MTEAVSKERTLNFICQIKGSVVYKVGAMAASFLAIPLMISYLRQVQFGVWSILLVETLEDGKTIWKEKIRELNLT